MSRTNSGWSRQKTFKWESRSYVGVSPPHLARPSDAITRIDLHDPQWNTYGNPPNSDLLRRYGHVDVIADNGSPADIVELRADLIVVVAAKRSCPKLDAAARAERVEWWLNEGGDE